MRYPKIRPLGHRDTDGILSVGDVVLLEKVDGANFRFTYHEDSGQILFGSRRQLFKEHDDPAPINRVNKAFRHAVEYVTTCVDMDELSELHDAYGGIWFFGESMHKHSIDYDAWDEQEPDVGGDVPNYLGFDVYAEGRDEFLPHKEVEDIHEAVGLETVPMVDQGPADDFEADDITVPQSAFRLPDESAANEFDRKGLAEGVVVKNTALDVRAKVVHEAFAETSNWSKTEPEELTKARQTAGAFVGQFVTDARIQKAAHKLVDEGEYEGLEMPMMADLPRRVASDVFAEHGWEILNDDDLELTAEAKAEVRSRISEKCSRVLRQMIRANAA